jgi:hypothetical protein
MPPNLSILEQNAQISVHTAERIENEEHNEFSADLLSKARRFLADVQVYQEMKKAKVIP